MSVSLSEKTKLILQEKKSGEDSNKILTGMVNRCKL